MSTPKPPPPRLGQMLASKGLVTEGDLLRALSLHEETKRPLGQILVELGAISVTALADALLVQHAWRPLGRMLVDKGVLTEEELAHALAEQERTGRPLGEIVRTGYAVPASLIGGVLAEQHELELEMDRGFGSGLRSGIDRRQRGASATLEEAPSREPTGPLGRRIDPQRAGDRLAVMQAALGDSEETVSSLGLANRDRGDEIARLRATIADQAELIESLRARITQLEAPERVGESAAF